MTGAIFISLICIGIYLLLRSRYTNLSFSKYISYSLAILIVGGIVLSIALAVGRVARRRDTPALIRDVIRTGIDLVNNRNERHENIQVIELNADDLDPQIQEALLIAIRRRGRRNLSTEDILKELNNIDAPQEGSCGVCYDDLEEGELLACPECKKGAHRDCIKDWIESGQNVCIYCRHNLIATL